MYLVKPLSRDKGKGQIHDVSALFALQIPWVKRAGYIVYVPFSLVPREGLYQIHLQSLNTHRGKHRSGGARVLAGSADFIFIQKTREGCGCPKFPAGKVFWQISTLLENDSPIFRQREMLSLPRFGHFPARKTAAGKLAAPAGTLLVFFH